MILYVTPRQTSNMLDFLDITIKKIEGVFQIKDFVDYDMQNYLYCNDVVLQRNAFEDNDEVLLAALQVLTTTYQSRITMIYENISESILIEFLKLGITNLVTTTNIRDYQTEIKECLDIYGLQTYKKIVEQEINAILAAAQSIRGIREKMKSIENEMERKIRQNTITPPVQYIPDIKIAPAKVETCNVKPIQQKRKSLFHIQKQSDYEKKIQEIYEKAQCYPQEQIIVTKRHDNLSVLFCKLTETGEFVKCIDGVDVICEENRDTTSNLTNDLMMSSFSSRINVNWNFFDNGI